MKRQFIIRKKVLATSVSEALRLDKKTPPDDIFIDEEWLKNQSREKSPAIGFINNE